MNPCANIFLCSLQTRYDFTVWYGVLLILVVDFLMFGIFCTFYYTYISEVAYGCLGALLYSLVRGKKLRDPIIKVLSFCLYTSTYILEAAFVFYSTTFI